MEQKRNTFSGSIGFVLAAAGSAVGLGNIWRFPYLAAKNGGGLFLVVYIILALTFGFTLLVSEVAIGRKTKQSCLTAYGKVNRRWGWLGGFASAVPFLIFPYYCVIGGWVLKYCIVFITGQGLDAANDSFFTGDSNDCWVQSAEMTRLRAECKRVSSLNMKRSYALVGPPGTGKTGMCEHLMTELCNDGYTLVRCSLDRRMMGVMLGKVLLTTKMTSKCAILFDDLDQLDIKRKGSDNVGEFLEFFAALNKSDVPIILFSTVNNPKNVNSTIMGRPERIDEVVPINTPDIGMTKELLRRYGKKNGYSISDDVLEQVGAELVELSASVADIKNLTVMMKVKHDAKETYNYDEFKVGIETLKQSREVARKNFCVDGDED